MKGIFLKTEFMVSHYLSNWCHESEEEVRKQAGFLWDSSGEDFHRKEAVKKVGHVAQSTPAVM